ncbi:helix-turn-helix protein [Actinoplanes xinjiangensis]|jgi:transcriptional regulator with XRE-family HTH domain|uniref:Helix-turn-helix protein n=1 Tax=Actinoplanes xinjiangensis TaxID=512350 RepID=A0A316EEQ2_9ACTN|nr:helix-turn-helix protein [Actinoplanes xinjiangensis]GIF44982.1 putative transcriptional regulatory protein [Actinoplanes xinjiangensis]
MPLLRRVIGAVLRRIRLGQGRTLREVAAAAGVSLPYLSEVERGTKEASSEVLAAICRALGLPMPDLLDEVRKEMLRQAPAPASRFVTHLSAGRTNGPRCAASRWMVCASSRVTVRL